MSSNDEATYTLHGVGLRIFNAAKTGAIAHENFAQGVPRLTRPTSDLFDPNLDVIVRGGSPAAAYFDWDDGTISACKATQRGAIGTTLVIQTDGDPVLEMACFDGSTTYVTPPSETVVYVSNTARHADPPVSADLAGPPRRSGS